MKLLVALGGNAIAVRGEPLTVARQVARVRVAAASLAELVDEGHELVVTHGNGPQVGFLASRATDWPLDVIGAETEGMLGYWIERELRNRLPGRSIATLLTQVEVARDDPAFAAPTKPVGPVLEAPPPVGENGRPDGFRYVREGDGVRRVVASPEPLSIVETESIEVLRRAGSIVVCAGGGGIPVVRSATGELEGVEAVIDKDRVAALLAEALECDGLLLLTDVEAVFEDWPRPASRPIRETSSEALARLRFAAGSMGPKVESACRFASTGKGFAAIGALESARQIVRGEAGTRIRP